MLYGAGYPGGKIFNSAAFTAAPAGQQGDFGRNVLRGFDATQADIGVQRVFRVTEKVSLRFRGEFFNILNHPNFGSPTNSLTSPLVRPLDANTGEQSGVRWRERRLQPSLPDWRPALDPAGAEAPILSALAGLTRSTGH